MIQLGGCWILYLIFVGVCYQKLVKWKRQLKALSAELAAHDRDLTRREQAEFHYRAWFK